MSTAATNGSLTFPPTTTSAPAPPPAPNSTSTSSSSSTKPTPQVGSSVKKSYTWRTYTADEVAQHSSSDSMWVIIHGRVYDVHAFLEDHPGGPEILTQHAGKDATQEFEETFHSPAARA